MRQREGQSRQQAWVQRSNHVCNRMCIRLDLKRAFIYKERGDNVSSRDWKSYTVHRQEIHTPGGKGGSAENDGRRSARSQNAAPRHMPRQLSRAEAHSFPKFLTHAHACMCTQLHEMQICRPKQPAVGIPTSI